MALTFLQLCIHEPDLEVLLREAQALPRVQADFCANDIWYARFRPRLEQLVGWDRGESSWTDEDQAKPKKSRIFSAEELAALPLPPVERHPILSSSEAYDVAYNTIYDALPACQHGGSCG